MFRKTMVYQLKRVRKTIMFSYSHGIFESNALSNDTLNVEHQVIDFIEPF